jgi:hypothetical protein
MPDKSGAGPGTPEPEPWPRGTSEMARRMRERDWTATALGAIGTWPQSLRSITDLLLASGFPMIALWGPDLIQIYNDGYRDLMGRKHPAGLGQPTRECWPEVWHINGPIHERVREGETVNITDGLYPLDRSGTVEDVWLTLSYSPLRDEAGGVAGVLVTLYETTARHLAEEQRARADRLLLESEAWHRLLIGSWAQASGKPMRMASSPPTVQAGAPIPARPWRHGLATAG